MRSHTALWIIAIIAIILFSPLIKSPDDYGAVIEWESGEALRWYGDDEAARINNGANSLYSVLMISTGIDPLIRKHFIKGEPEPDLISQAVDNSESMSGFARALLSYWAGFLSNIYLLCLRVAHSWFWTGYLVPFVLAIVWDGYMTRKAKLSSFSYTSPTVYNLSWHAIIFIFSVTAVCFTLAVKIPVLFYPLSVSICGVLMRLVIGNIQHSA